MFRFLFSLSVAFGLYIHILVDQVRKIQVNYIMSRCLYTSNLQPYLSCVKRLSRSRYLMAFMILSCYDLFSFSDLLLPCGIHFNILLGNPVSGVLSRCPNHLRLLFSVTSTKSWKSFQLSICSFAIFSLPDTLQLLRK